MNEKLNSRKKGRWIFFFIFFAYFAMPLYFVKEIWNAELKDDVYRGKL